MSPNIIFILADDLRCGDLGGYGQELIQTAKPEKVAELRALLARWESQMLPAKPRAARLNAQEQEWFPEHAGRKTNSSVSLPGSSKPASTP